MSLSTLPNYPLTTLYSHPSDSNDLLIFIPGNPGLAEYYITYLELIRKQYPRFEIMCISHAGYQTSDDYMKGNQEPFEYYDLQYQIQHKVDIIKDKVKQKSQGKPVNLYLFSHSVGGYFVQRIVNNLLTTRGVKTKINIKLIALICPTVIDIGKSSSGQKLISLLTYLPLVTLATVLVTIVRLLFSEATAKSIIRNWIFSAPKSATKEAQQSIDHSVEATYKLATSKRLVKQATTMAIDEVKEIHRDDEINDWFFTELPKKIKLWTYFAHQDHWVHDSSRDYLLLRYHDINNDNVLFTVGNVDDGISHSFCVDQSVEFAEITLAALKDLGVK